MALCVCHDIDGKVVNKPGSKYITWSLGVEEY